MAKSDEHEADSRHRGPSHASPYGLSRLAAPISLVDVAKEIEQANQMIASTAGAELTLIAEQMRALSEKAREVLERARLNADLHRAHSSFKRIPGKIYHLYTRDDGERYWSLLSPEDWQGAPPHAFSGSFRLEADQSWTSAADLQKADETRALVKQVLETKLLPK